MFIGIVSAVAKVVEAGGGRLAIDHAAIAKHLKRGGSIAVNGCCLTVVKKKGPVFYADVVPETLRRTNLGALKPGSEVNLELPLNATSTLDGHLVQGHVDATATVRLTPSTAIDPFSATNLEIEAGRSIVTSRPAAALFTDVTVAVAST